EVLTLHGPAELLPQIEQVDPRVSGAAGARQDVALADVLARAVEAAQQIAQVSLERLVALGAAQAPRFAEIPQGGATCAAAQPVRRGGEQARPPLPHRLNESADRGLEVGTAGPEALPLTPCLPQLS